MDYIHKYNPWGDDVSCTISRSKVKAIQVLHIFAVGAGVVDYWSTISSLYLPLFRREATARAIILVVEFHYNAVQYCKRLHK